MAVGGIPNTPGSATNLPRVFEQQQPGLSWSQTEFCSSVQHFHAIDIPIEGGYSMKVREACRIKWWSWGGTAAAQHPPRSRGTAGFEPSPQTFGLLLV